MFPARRFGGGALAVYVDGQPAVDVWSGWADRGGHVPWSADTAPMVFSATKGMTSTVIHRLADRGLIDYEAPLAEYWPEFAANGKANLTVREVMRHTAGLSGLRGATHEDLLDHVVMEERLAAAHPGRLLGKSAYLKTEDDSYRKILRQMPLYQRAIQTGMPFPKTRRVIFEGGQPASLPGWILVETVG